VRTRLLMSEHKKRPRDANQLAKSIVDIATGETEDREPTHKSYTAPSPYASPAAFPSCA
jgi:hypothetical protein